MILEEGPTPLPLKLRLILIPSIWKSCICRAIVSPRRAVQHNQTEGVGLFGLGFFWKPRIVQSDSDEYWYLCRHITSCKSWFKSCSGGRLRGLAWALSSGKRRRKALKLSLVKSRNSQWLVSAYVQGLSHVEHTQYGPTVSASECFYIISTASPFSLLYWPPGLSLRRVPLESKGYHLGILAVIWPCCSSILVSWVVEETKGQQYPWRSDSYGILAREHVAKRILIGCRQVQIIHYWQCNYGTELGQEES